MLVIQRVCSNGIKFGWLISTLALSIPYAIAADSKAVASHEVVTTAANKSAIIAPILASAPTSEKMSATFGSSLEPDTVGAGAFSIPDPIRLRIFADVPFKTHVLDGSRELFGSVRCEEQIGPVEIISKLVDVAIERDEARQLLEKRQRLHAGKTAFLFGRAKDMLQYATTYQGFESSSEAADVILEEKLKLKSKAAVEFVRQKKLDAVHLALTTAILQIAMGSGLTDQARREEVVKAGMAELKSIVGEDKALEAKESLVAWSGQAMSSEAAAPQEPWDVLMQRNKATQILASALEDDSVVKSIEDRLHKYNRHSNFSRATSKFVNTTLSIVAFTPTFASPAAQAAQFVYVACTGGPEEKKLLKEVYLDRCFESRFNRINQESGLVVNSYNNAIMTNNKALFCCSDLIMRSLAKPEVVSAVTQSVTTAQTASRKSFGDRI